jgi:Type II secretion system (T2SS), protein E, N-terminal domain
LRDADYPVGDGSRLDGHRPGHHFARTARGRVAHPEDRKNVRIGSLLVELGYVTEAQLADLIADQLRLPAVDLSTADISQAAIAKVPKELAVKHRCRPRWTTASRRQRSRWSGRSHWVTPTWERRQTSGFGLQELQTAVSKTLREEQRVR